MNKNVTFCFSRFDLKLELRQEEEFSITTWTLVTYTGAPSLSPVSFGYSSLLRHTLEAADDGSSGWDPEEDLDQVPGFLLWPEHAWLLWAFGE